MSLTRKQKGQLGILCLLEERRLNQLAERALKSKHSPAESSAAWLELKAEFTAIREALNQ